MHTNEKFMKNISDEELLALMFEAEAKGKAYVDALKEQITRLDAED